MFPPNFWRCLIPVSACFWTLVSYIFHLCSCHYEMYDHHTWLCIFRLSQPVSQCVLSCSPGVCSVTSHLVCLFLQLFSLINVICLLVFADCLTCSRQIVLPFSPSMLVIIILAGWVSAVVLYLPLCFLLSYFILFDSLGYSASLIPFVD